MTTWRDYTDSRAIPCIRQWRLLKEDLNKSCSVIGECRNPEKSTAWTPAFAGVTTYSDIPLREIPL
jgi:hypothetical protein